MRRFTLSPEHTQAAQTILSDCGVVLDKRRHQILNSAFDVDFHEDELYELGDALDALLDCDLKLPLFAEDSERERVVRNQQNYMVVKSFKEEVDKELAEMEGVMLSSAAHDDYRLIRQGEYVVRLMGKQFLELDFAKYGFSDAFQMAYVLGAYISNALIEKDAREVEVRLDDVLYIYENHGHADFRLAKFDMTQYTSIDPLDKTTVLPFGEPKLIGRILGYHSVETYMLSIFLGYLELAGLSAPVVDGFDDFDRELSKAGQALSNCSDSGMYDDMQVTLGFGGLKFGALQKMYPEPGNEFFYENIVKDDELVVLKKYTMDSPGKEIMRIPHAHIDEIIKALFYKVAYGNGRSCVAALRDTMNFYRVKYKGVPLSSVTFNKDIGDYAFGDTNLPSTA